MHCSKLNEDSEHSRFITLPYLLIRLHTKVGTFEALSHANTHTTVDLSGVAHALEWETWNTFQLPHAIKIVNRSSTANESS